MSKTHKILLGIFALGVILRVWYINFGLPYHTHNDEPELVEMAITAAVEPRKILNDLTLLKPKSFIYGTTPTYFITPFMTIYSQMNQLVGINFDKADLYIKARVTTAITSALLIVFVYNIYTTLFENKKKALLAAALTALNWKLIVFSHFVNADIYLTLTTTLLILFILKYLRQNKLIYILLAGIFCGLSFGTKITGIILTPVILYIFATKKDLKGFLLFSLTGTLSFAISNPFAIIYFNEFMGRIVKMATLEGGAVFSSASNNPIRYLLSIGYIATPLLAIASLYGKYISLKNKKDIASHIFLIGSVVTYILFFTLAGNRQTDRWMLPILPIIIVYATYGIATLFTKLSEIQRITTAVVISITVLYLPILLIFQFKALTPKAEAYLWSKDNLPETAAKLVITESGDSVFTDLANTDIYLFNVYESKSAQDEMPPTIVNYDYVIVASKTMLNHKRPYVKRHFPDYANRWNTFVKQLETLPVINRFELPKPNIITLSDITIYEITDNL